MRIATQKHFRYSGFITQELLFEALTGRMRAQSEPYSERNRPSRKPIEAVAGSLKMPGAKAVGIERRITSTYDKLALSPLS